MSVHSNAHDRLRWLTATIIACLLSLPALADDSQWESEVQALEARTRSAPVKDPVVFIGSSSIRLWSSIHEDLAPIPVVQHGFGGSRLGDSVRYADRLVNAWHPRAVVLFAGSNDILPDAVTKPEAVLEKFKAFIARVRAQRADLPVYFIAITPSPSRWSVWPTVQRANGLIADYARTQTNVHIIDLNKALLGPNGEPDPRFYISDQLHMSDSGYRIWASEIRTRLLKDMPAVAKK